MQGKDAVPDESEELAEGAKVADETMEKVLDDSNAAAQQSDIRRETSSKLEAKKDQRLYDFLHNTETNIKIFFSSYWRDKGLAWFVSTS